MMNRKRIFAGNGYRPFPKRLKASFSNWKLAKLQRKVNRLSPEVKDFVLTSVIFNPTSAAGQIDYLSALSTGASDNQRIGKKIVVKRIRLHLTTNTAPVTNTANEIASIFLVKDKESGGVIPTIAGAATSIFSSFNPALAVQARETKDRFTILRRWDITGAAVSTGQYNIHGYRYDKRCNHIVHFSDDSATIAGSGKNAFYLVGLTNDDTFDYNYSFEMDFTDM